MSNRRIKSVFLAVMITIASSIGVLLTSSSASAITVNEIKNKYVARGFEICYKNYMKRSGIKPENMKSFADIMYSEGIDKSVVGFPPGYSKVDFSGTEIPIRSCSGLLKLYGIEDNFAAENGVSYTDKNTQLLRDLGYKEVTSTENTGRKCQKFNFGIAVANGTGPRSTKEDAAPEFCAEVENGVVKSATEYVPVVRSTNGQDVGVAAGENGHIYVVVADVQTDLKVEYVNANWDTLVTNIDKALSDYKYNPDDPNKSVPAPGNTQDDSSLYYMGKGESRNTGAGISTWELKDPIKDSYKAAYEKLTQTSWPGDEVNDNQKAALYMDYLTTYYGLTVTECADKKHSTPPDSIGSEAPSGQATGWHEVKMYNESGKAQYCYAGTDDSSAAEQKVFGVTMQHQPAMVQDGMIGLLDIIQWLNAHAPDSIPKELASSIGEANEPTEEKTGNDEGSKSCFDGAGALGWVLCPILEGTSWAVNQLYSGFIEPALTINADLLTFDSNGDKGAYATWQTFQTFANIAFVIMILVVIFSQLTGVGIDNYGIKRILPRLIIAAILINLSFIICQLLVDLSNILGVSLKNLFNSLGPDYKSVGGSTGGAIFVDILVGVVAVGGAFLALGLGVLIPIIVAAISALIAIFFLFLVLAGRQAAVVILVVISPIALVMYMLPNTKKYFDKFVKIFVTLLVVFPVCGLLMGGGDFASRVLLQAGQASADSFSSTGEGFFYQISAVLVSIVPFFFIPSLVKGSLAGLGNIGSKISGIGSKVGGKASGKARSTLGNTKLGDPSRFRMRSRARQADRQNYKEIQFNRRRAGYDRDGNLTKRGRRMRRRAQGLTAGGLVMTRGQRERAQMRLDAAEATMLANERKLSNAGLHIRNQDEHVSSARAGMEAAEMDQQVKEQLALLRQRDEDGTVIADSPDRLGAEHADMLDRLNANPNDETAQARLRAVQSLLAGSDPGREHLSNNLDRAARSGQNTAVTIAASHLMEDHGGAIKAGNRDEEKWLQSAAGGNVQSRDNFSLQGLSGYTAQSLADADDRAHDALINNFKSMTPEQQETVRHLAWEMNNNPGINAKESVKQKFADLAKGYTPEPNRQEAELQNQTQILNDINDQLHHGPNGQQGTPPKPQPQPQPKDNGPSTEDWEDYTRGTGDFAP